MSSFEGGSKKIGFSLSSKKKGKKRASTTAASKAAGEFGDPEEDQKANNDETINHDIPKKPLVIPCKKDSRKSLQEQARTRRQKEQPDAVSSNDVATSGVLAPESKGDSDKPAVKKEGNSTDSSDVPASAPHTDEDRAAIQALKREAAVAQGKGDDGWNGTLKSTNKRVIASTEDTFQRQRDEQDDDQKKFEADIEDLPPEISVESKVYEAVPISEFGAALLRGMGWNGGNEKDGTNRQNRAPDPTTMPRPSRLGLGATPKILGSGDVPNTHSRRRPRRQDQVQREEQLKQQRGEMEKERQRQLSLDKQRVLQLGSIVYVHAEDSEDSRRRRRRAIIQKLTGVAGLNMILVQHEGDSTPSKVRKGSIELVERIDLNERPFQYKEEEPRRRSSEDMSRTKKEDRKHRDYEKRDYDSRSTNDRITDDRRRDRKRERDRNKDRRHSDSNDDVGRNRDRDRDRDRDRRKRKREDEKHRDGGNKSSRPTGSIVSTSWLIPNIRVRVVSSRYGQTLYKEKGVVLDVTRKGVATLKMDDGQVVNVAERHLETALPKVGGRSIILSGDHRFSKGQMLERDSKKNRGVVQVFEDMSVVTTSLDEMAEWCGPLDDDLEH